MKYLLTFVCLLGSLLGAPLTGTFSADYVSRYVFRGVEVDGASIQPSANVEVGAFYGTIWGSRSLDNTTSEVDLTLGVGGAGGLDAGITAYTYPGRSDTTWEPYLGYGREVGPAELSVVAFRDLTLHVTTFEGRAAFELATTKTYDLTFDFAIGNSRGRDLPSYTYWAGGPTLTYRFGERLSATLGAQYASSSDDTVRRDLVVSRVGLTFTF